MLNHAKWIRCKVETDGSVLRFQKSLTVKKQVKRATLLASAMGIYNLYINGDKVGDSLLCPGFTAYNERLQYQTYDITALLTDSTDVAIDVAEGWALGRFGLVEMNANKIYADHVSAIAEIEIEYADETAELITTDEDWDVYKTNVTFASIYDGEARDLTLERGKLEKMIKKVISQSEITK